MCYRPSALLAAILLLVVWIATPLLAVGHVAVEEHRYCVEHQRLEEGANTHRGDASIEASPEIVVSERILRVSELPERSHEVCASVECLSVDTLRPDNKAQNVVAVKSQYTALVLLKAQDSYQIAPITIAPKCSPPHLI